MDTRFLSFSYQQAFINKNNCLPNELRMSIIETLPRRQRTMRIEIKPLNLHVMSEQAHVKHGSIIWRMRSNKSLCVQIHSVCVHHTSRLTLAWMVARDCITHRTDTHKGHTHSRVFPLTHDAQQKKCVQRALSKQHRHKKTAWQQNISTRKLTEPSLFFGIAFFHASGSMFNPGSCSRWGMSVMRPGVPVHQPVCIQLSTYGYVYVYIGANGVGKRTLMFMRLHASEVPQVDHASQVIVDWMLTDQRSLPCINDKVRWANR